MANLNGNNVGTNYKGILNLDTLNQPLDTTSNLNLSGITDGMGNQSGLSISQTSIAVSNQLYIGNNGASNWEPAIYNYPSSNVNISVNPNNIVVSEGYSTGSTSNAIFEMASTTQGMLLPRMTTLERNAISHAEDGLIVYDTDLNQICYYNGAIIRWFSLDASIL
jgi:hypothetical protein